MESQPPPTSPAPATFALHAHPDSHLSQHSSHAHHAHHAHQRSPQPATRDHHDAHDDRAEYQRYLDAQSQRGSKGSNRRGHDSVISHPFSPKASSPPSPSSSVSSATRKHRSIEDGQHASADIAFPQRAHVDPEKASFAPHSPRSPTRVSDSNKDVATVLYDSGEYHEKEPEEKSVQLLLYLSGPCALLSLLIAAWTLPAVLVALLIQPLRLFTKRPTLSAQLTAFLAPSLNLQLHLIYSCSAATDYSAPMLIVIHLASPFVAMGVALAAWTAAFFWFFSAILGDPAGQDGHNDGKDSILGVRSWWDRWLSRGLR